MQVKSNNYPTESAYIIKKIFFVPTIIQNKLKNIQLFNCTQVYLLRIFFVLRSISLSL